MFRMIESQIVVKIDWIVVEVNSYHVNSIFVYPLLVSWLEFITFAYLFHCGVHYLGIQACFYGIVEAHGTCHSKWDFEIL